MQKGYKRMNNRLNFNYMPTFDCSKTYVAPSRAEWPPAGYRWERCSSGARSAAIIGRWPTVAAGRRGVVHRSACGVRCGRARKRSVQLDVPLILPGLNGAGLTAGWQCRICTRKILCLT